ncbi:DUF58 domain-containing protein [Hydrogenibacillus sp. N12]|uniref:DUF58 domain-containing protein n=1 Tax=Hydrogenibacillus sp. N12 TaxID=2866627 RepID=UPI001C7DB795|nr:DUF58 domain-containing protein [Hydrogenibacillus sp. N12]QZA32826.1 DUF58 domain-containing protein [Hydrogenibacillus sp. N12]
MGGWLRLIGLAAALFGYRQFQGGWVSNFLLVTLAAAAGVSLWSAAAIGAGVRVRRTLPPGPHEAGTLLFVTLEVEGRLPLGLFWLAVAERLDGAVVRRDVRLFLGRRWRVTVPLGELPRGRHRLGPIDVEAGDLFGFVHRRWRLPEEVEIQVRPKPLPATAVLKERRRLRWTDGTGEPSELRPFRPGDRVSRIRWKASARAGELLVADRSPEAAGRAVVVLDVFRPAEPEAFERDVALAATWLKALVSAGVPVGLWTWTDEGPRFIPPTRHRALVERMWELLVDVRPIDRPPPGEGPRLSAATATIPVGRRPTGI